MLGKNKTCRHPPVCSPSTVSNTICMKWLFLRAEGQDKATESFISISKFQIYTTFYKAAYKVSTTQSRNSCKNKQSIRLRQTSASPRKKHHLLMSISFQVHENDTGSSNLNHRQYGRATKLALYSKLGTPRKHVVRSTTQIITKKLNSDMECNN